MKTQDIEYGVGGVRYVGHLAVDDQRGGKRPGVLVAPEAGGLGKHAKDVADRLASLGYVAFAMDYYGENPPTGPSDMMARVGAFIADPTGIRAIASAALEVLKAQAQTDPTRLAAIGYCFGGTTALELARSGASLAAAVGFHSGLATARPRDAAQIKAKVLALIGAEDPLIPPDQRAGFEKEMTAGKVDWRMITYGGAGHSFTNPDAGSFGMAGLAYDKATDERSWRAMLDLFAEVFGSV